MDFNLPEVVFELTDAFDTYEVALVENDVATHYEFFRSAAEVVRYGPKEALYGHDEMLAFRKARRAQGLARERTHQVATTFGKRFGTAVTEFRRANVAATERQNPAWVRFDHGWRVVASHVSFLAN